MTELLDHLNPLEQKGMVKLWVDTYIDLGSDWDIVIKNHVKGAAILLFLLSPSSLNSGYIKNVELKIVIEKSRKNEVFIIPILIRPCAHHGLDITRRQWLPRDGRAVTDRSWGRRDNAYKDIVSDFEKQLMVWNETQTFPPEYSGREIDTAPATKKKSQALVKRIKMIKSKKKLVLTQEDLARFSQQASTLLRQLWDLQEAGNFREPFGRFLERAKRFSQALQDMLDSTTVPYLSLSTDLAKFERAWSLADQEHTKSLSASNAANERIQSRIVPQLIVACENILITLQKISGRPGDISPN